MNPISASPLAVASYALPHIIHAIATKSRLGRNNRHSFWSAIQETALALFLVRVTIVSLLFPRRRKPEMATKGSGVGNGFFDLAAVYPNLILSFLLLAGVISGLVGMAFVPTEQSASQARLLATIWATTSLLTVMAALATCRKTRQTPLRPVLRTAAPVTIHLPDGRIVPGMTGDLSQDGACIVAKRPDGVSAGLLCQLEFTAGGQPVLVRSQTTRWEQRVMQVSFQPQTVAEEAAVVQAVFGRADAWVDWAAYPVDRPVASLYRALISIRGLFRPRDRTPLSSDLGDTAAQRQPVQRNEPDPLVAPMPRAGLRLVKAAAIVLALVLVTTVVQAQTLPAGGFVVRPSPPPVPQLQEAEARLGLLHLPAIALPASQSSPASVPMPPETTRMGQTRRVVLTLRQLGAPGPLTLRGTSELQGVPFGIRTDEVVMEAVLTLSGATSPALIDEFSNVTVTLNEQYVGTVPSNRERPRFEGLQMPVSPVFFQDTNRLNFGFSGRYTTECNDPLSSLLWSTISDTSTLTLTLERLPAQRDLNRLPLPFFDAHETQSLVLPFVMLPGAANETLQAAGIVASWFGQQTGARGTSFPVSADAPSKGNSVVFVSGQDRPGNVDLPPITGPTLAVLPNPTDPGSSLLVIAGRDAREVMTAAQALTLGRSTLGREMARVTAPEMPLRKPYDAPAWIATDRPIKFGELVGAPDLQGTGFVPGTMRVLFRAAPDLYTWRNRAFPMDIRFRAPPGPIVDLAVSRLDVGINNLYLASMPLADAPSRNAAWLSRIANFGVPQPGSRIDVPAYDISAQNDLQFFFDTRPLHRGDCMAIP